MIAKYLIQLRQSKLCRKGCCQPPYDVTSLETAMPLGVKGRRSYPLLRLGSYKPMAFWPRVVDVLFQEVLPVFRAVAAFGGVYDVIRFDENLVVDTVNIRVGMVMAHQIGYPLHLIPGQARVRQEAAHQGTALFLLPLAVGVAVFFPAQGAGDVMGDGGDLQCLLRLPVQVLQLADGFGVGPHAHKMVHVTQVPVGECDHFFHYFGMDTPSNVKHWAGRKCRSLL